MQPIRPLQLPWPLWWALGEHTIKAGQWHSIPGLLVELEVKLTFHSGYWAGRMETWKWCYWFYHPKGKSCLRISQYERKQTWEIVWVNHSHGAQKHRFPLASKARLSRGIPGRLYKSTSFSSMRKSSGWDKPTSFSGTSRCSNAFLPIWISNYKDNYWVCAVMVLMFLLWECCHEEY